MPGIRRTLLVDDDPNDVEIALLAVATNNLANEVIVECNGAKASDVVSQCGLFWTVLNEPPPGSLVRSALQRSTGEA